MIAARMIPVNEALSAFIQYLAPTANNEIAIGIPHSYVSLSRITNPPKNNLENCNMLFD